MNKIRIACLTALLAITATLSAQTNKPTHFKFNFGAETPGATRITPASVYNDSLGYGFEPGSTLQVSPGGSVFSDTPFYFSVAVPDGNYKVTVTLGDADKDSLTTVKAELRRLMLEKVVTTPGKLETRTFSVNVRTPQISTGGQVRLKGARESVQEAWNWDPRLTLQFSNAHPVVRSIEIEKVNIPTIFILGDSTSCDQMAEPFSSWGQSITRFFKPDVAVSNHGESGESMGAAISAKRTDKIYDTMKAGDFLLIQFGHNDMKATQPTAVDSFKDGLKRAVEEARKKNVTSVLITPVSRRTFRGNEITNSFVTNAGVDYLEAVKYVTNETGATLIDLNASSKILYETFGDRASHGLFATPTEGTHHNNFGSYEIAKCVLEGIKAARLDIAKFIVDDYSGFDPSKPDSPASFDLPQDARASADRPPGN